jgi:hypothetical protein
MAQAIAPRRPQTRPVSPISRTIDLASLHGEVHRFTGVIDRFGSYEKGGNTIRTVCIRELRLDQGGNQIRPDHWWFRLREVWSEAGVRVGDTVLFTAKVQRCSKGPQDPRTGEAHSEDRRSRRQREQVMGFGACPRSVVILKRRQGVNHQLAELEQEHQHTSAELDLARADLARTLEHRDQVLQQADRLQQDLLASRSQMLGLRQRARKAGALLLCLGSVGGFTVGWAGAQWKQAQVESAPVSVAETVNR